MTPTEWHQAYDAWMRQRRILSLGEEQGPLPTANEWEWSDDEAVALLHVAADLVPTETEEA